MWVISKHNIPDQAARIAKELIDAGADVNAKDNKGMCPLDWAWHHRNRLRDLPVVRIAEELVFTIEAAKRAIG